jgi:exodeoxyribonuclease VII large subunit
VQGAEAPPQLKAGVEYFNAMENVDVIIIGRGGGSIEDLWAFNDEALARAVAASEIPIISAVGHETDFTLCDFVADCRAPTPSAAAEIAVPDARAIFAYTEQSADRMTRAMIARLTRCNEDVLNMEKIIALNSPSAILERHSMALKNFGVRIEGAMSKRLAASGSALAEVSAKLSGLNPLGVLSRGYSAVKSADGRVIGSVDALGVGDHVSIVMSDGVASATVDGISKNK